MSVIRLWVVKTGMSEMEEDEELWRSFVGRGKGWNLYDILAAGLYIFSQA